ncbi:MAG: GH92 family glycosyl hydrolase [Planctomycetota bacterium]
MAELIDLVNPLCGSDSEPEFSTGLTYPAVGVPWGMTYFSPTNRPGGQVFARRRSWPANTLAGFAATHAPSHWMGDYGSFAVMPGIGQPTTTPSPTSASYRLDTETSRPDLYRVRLTGSDIRCELTATARCGMLRLTYPDANTDADHQHLTLQLASDACTAEPCGTHELIGTARNGQGLVDGFACRFVLRFDRPIQTVDAHPDRRHVIRFEPGGSPVTVTMATSFVDHDQARRNADREIGGRDFDAVRAETADTWNRHLARIQLTGGTHAQHRTFRTCLWRASLFPRTLTEFDANDAPIHRSPYTGNVEPGRLVTDNGFWDTSRTVYPLLALVWPTKLGEILDGWLTAYRQSGWMPQWASPGHRSCMVGTHSAAVFADAITKRITGFDHELAFASMLNDATVPGDPDGKFGRQQLPEYHALGYCPEVGADDSVCRTLDYAYNDWCVAAVAEALGKTEHVVTFRERADNWKKLFDRDTGFIRPRTADGEWAGPLREFRWGGPYREGGPWQYRFAVPHDPHGLAELLGDPDGLAEAVGRMAETPPRFDVGSYGREIHEMTEMAAANFGQYAHSNQPVHAVLFLPARVGRPDITDTLVRRVLDELYTPDTFPGDEDNGEMAAWYVLCAIGLCPHCPGDPAYTQVPPLFDTVTIQTDAGQTITPPPLHPTRNVRHSDVVAQ